MLSDTHMDPIRPYLVHRALNKFDMRFSRAIDNEGNFTVTAFGMSGVQAGHLTWNPHTGEPVSAGLADGQRQRAKAGAIIGEAHLWAFDHANDEIQGPNPHRVSSLDFYPSNEPPIADEGTEYPSNKESQESTKITGNLPPFGDRYDVTHTEALRRRKKSGPATYPQEGYVSSKQSGEKMDKDVSAEFSAKLLEKLSMAGGTDEIDGVPITF